MEINKEQLEKPTKSVFVIMPFSRTPTRDKDALDEFFRTNIKGAIENYSGFVCRYIVSRSADEYLMNESIIRSLFSADIVLCDLSGGHGNPNVMFELGIRLSLTTSPVILFRENHPDNRPIFDIAAHYTEKYEVTKYRLLEEYIIKKIQDYEGADFKFESPVLNAIGNDPQVIKLLTKGRQYRRLQLLQFAIHQNRATLGGDVLTFLRKHGVRDAPELPMEDFFQWLVSNSDELKSLPWKEFDFPIYSSPMLEGFLSNPDLEGALPSAIVDRFLIYFTAFYDLFWTSRMARDSDTLKSINIYFVEWYLLQQIVISLMLFMKAHDAEQETFALERFEMNFKRSAVGQYAEDSIGIVRFEAPGKSKDQDKDFDDVVIKRNA